MTPMTVDDCAIVAFYFLVLSLHALGPVFPLDVAPDYTVAAMFAALAGLFGLSSLRRIVERHVGRAGGEI